MKCTQCDKTQPENCKNCSSKCAYDCAQLSYTIQHRTVLIISPSSYLQIKTIAQMLSIRGERYRTFKITKCQQRVINRCSSRPTSAMYSNVKTAAFLARDVIYTTRAYATMSVSICLSVCLSVTEVQWCIIAKLCFKF